MSDDRTTLEQLLRERAAEIPYFQEAPRPMLVRARRRIVRNALTSVLAIGLIVVGASAGLAGLGALRSPSTVPGHSGAIHTPAPAFSASSCSAADLRATASLQGAAGSVIGSVDLTNFSSKTCTLAGRPTITLFSSAGRALTVHLVDVVPQWRADGAPRPKTWPVVNLRPGAAAAIRVRWTNECPQLSHPALWKVGLSGSGSLDVFGADGTYPPPCNGSTQPSTLEVGPFEPSP